MRCAPHTIAAGAVIALLSVDVRSQEQIFTVLEPDVVLGGDFANLGDVNGDGISDFAAMDGTQPGEVHVYSGAGGGLLWNKQNRKTTRLSRASLATLGDIDGDGVHELGVAVTLANTPSAVGICWILSGVDGRTLQKLRGDDAILFGQAIVGLDDLDGDLVPDWCTSDENEVLVFSGATGNLIYSIPPEPDSSVFGDSLDVVGDLDGDGVRDLLVGDRFNYSGVSPALGAGAVHVYSGATGTRIRTLFGTLPEEEFGATVVGMDDVDQDGMNDILIAAPANQSLDPAIARGRVYAYSGRTGTNLYMIRGNKGERIGNTVALIGDVTGDGLRDFGVAPSGPSVVHGRLLHDGRNGETLASLDPYSVRSGAFLGMNDLDGDGRDDFLCAGSNPTGRLIEAYRSTDLYLFSEEKPKQVELRVNGGVPFSAVAIYVVRINGENLDRFVSFGTLDANGQWIVPTITPPPGLGKLVVRCQAFAVSPTGQLTQSVSILVNAKS